ncbi:hypothetical protein BJY52DRAFT_1268375 [Lactarius psammicola]|nr:hypothetical protein BJY52DRAFT_1268375 [Lactarius psammicola]
METLPKRHPPLMQRLFRSPIAHLSVVIISLMGTVARPANARQFSTKAISLGDRGWRPRSPGNESSDKIWVGSDVPKCWVGDTWGAAGLYRSHPMDGMRVALHAPESL